MKLIFLYGPPASGKLTVAQELEKLTNYRLFHNHMTIDLARKIMPEASLERSALINRLRLCVMDSASKANINLLFTFVRKTMHDDEFIAEVINTVEGNGGEVCFVHLVPSLSTVEKRLEEDSRKGYSKIKEIQQLRKLMAKGDIYAPIDHSNNMTIDNSDKSAAEVALEVAHFLAFDHTTHS